MATTAVASSEGTLKRVRKSCAIVGTVQGEFTFLHMARFLNHYQARKAVTDMAGTQHIVAKPVQKVVVVNGNTEVLTLLETVLEAGRYDMVFVESGDRAYSQIRRVLPNLVILCARIEDLDGFQLLTMLKLDPETRQIPVLTYTTECEGQDFDAAISQIAEEEEDVLPTRSALRMN
jgi:CheY-like chemotaxis protein